MKRITKIALGVGTALTLGLGAAMVSAHPQGYGYGPGMGYGMGWGGHMGGYGPQGMMGYGYGPGMGYGMGGGRGHMGGYGPQGMMGYGYANPGAAAGDRLTDLKAELKITDQQESAWKAYAEQVKTQTESMQAWHTAMWNSAQLSAPERLAQRDAMLKQRLAQHEAMTAAFKDLYAALTPEQRAVVDQGFLAMRSGPRGPGGPGARFR